MLEKLSACPAGERRAFRVMHGRQTCSGFTLFEVSISLVLVAFGVISVMALFPIGIKAEQMARMRLFAAVKAEEILDAFATTERDAPGIDVEAPFEWEVPVTHRPFVPDLEVFMATAANGIIPVPPEIARRLESDNDEIRKLIERGGHLYYSKPSGTGGFNNYAERFRNYPRDPLTQRVVFGIVGSAQNNSVVLFPKKAWPYYNAYPSGPSYGVVGGTMAIVGDAFRDVLAPSSPPDSTDVSFMGGDNVITGYNTRGKILEYKENEPSAMAFSVWEGTSGGTALGSGETATGSLDPDIRVVFSNGYRPYTVSQLWCYKYLADKDDFIDDPSLPFKNPQPVCAATIANSGDNYEVGDILTTVGDTGSPATFMVTAIEMNPLKTPTMHVTLAGQTVGPVTNINIVNGGLVTVAAANPHATTTPNKNMPAPPAPVPNPLKEVGSGCQLTLFYGPKYYQTLLGAQRYVQTCLWYCERSQSQSAKVPTEFYYPTGVTATAEDGMKLAIKNIDIFKSIATEHKWKSVQALRFLSHAATCLSNYSRKADATLTPPVDKIDPNVAGVALGKLDVPQSKNDVLNNPGLKLEMKDFTVNQGLTVYYHELAMRMAMLYAASQPYDWGAPRPTQRPLFTDQPLIEHDLFSIPNLGQIEGAAAGTNGSQWRPIPSSPIANIGRSASFPNTPIPPNPSSLSWKWGQAENFTLTKQFEPAERCRELVFWSVDWLSYVDAETQPGPNTDASRVVFSAPIHTQGTALTPTSFLNTNSLRMTFCNGKSYGQFIFNFDNPERDYAFSRDVSKFPTGFNWPSRDVSFSDGGEWNGTNDARNVSGQIVSQYDSTGVMIYRKENSRFGADRNGNQRLDRGPVPASTRLRASTLVRYLFYDPRLNLKLR